MHQCVLKHSHPRTFSQISSLSLEKAVHTWDHHCKLLFFPNCWRIETCRRNTLPPFKLYHRGGLQNTCESTSSFVARGCIFGLPSCWSINAFSLLKWVGVGRGTPAFHWLYKIWSYDQFRMLRESLSFSFLLKACVCILSSAWTLQVSKKGLLSSFEVWCRCGTLTTPSVPFRGGSLFFEVQCQKLSQQIYILFSREIIR